MLTSQNVVERTGAISQDNFMSVNRVINDSRASYSWQVCNNLLELF